MLNIAPLLRKARRDMFMFLYTQKPPPFGGGFYKGDETPTYLQSNTTASAEERQSAEG